MEASFMPWSMEYCAKACSASTTGASRAGKPFSLTGSGGRTIQGDCEDCAAPTADASVRNDNASAAVVIFISVAFILKGAAFVFIKFLTPLLTSRPLHRRLFAREETVEQHLDYARRLGFEFGAAAQLARAEAVGQQRVRRRQKRARGRSRVAEVEDALAPPFVEHFGDDFGFFFEVATPAREQPRTQRREQVAQTFGVVLHAVESEHDAQHEHAPQTRRGRTRPARNLYQLFLEPRDDAVNVREDYVLLAREVQVDSPLADADLLREVFHRHLPVAVAREQAIRGVEYEVAYVFACGD